MNTSRSLSELLRQERSVHVIGTIALVVAGLGYWAGSRQPESREPEAPKAVPASADPARSYGELRSFATGPNADMYQGQVAGLAPEHDVFANVVQSEADRLATLEGRRQRRAYDRAPPVIPHAVDQRGFPDCLACHERGATLAGRVAPKISHARYDSCTQCHVVAASPQPWAEPPALTDNGFVGSSPAVHGERAWAGAPPTIPHATNMRSQCQSCHGPGGLHGVRSTHPWRQSCTQCHVPSAALDQVPASDVAQLPLGGSLASSPQEIP